MVPGRPPPAPAAPVIPADPGGPGAPGHDAATGSYACLTRHGCRGGRAAGRWWRQAGGATGLGLAGATAAERGPAHRGRRRGPVHAAAHLAAPAARTQRPAQPAQNLTEPAPPSPAPRPEWLKEHRL